MVLPYTPTHYGNDDTFELSEMFVFDGFAFFKLGEVFLVDAFVIEGQLSE